MTHSPTLSRLTSPTFTAGKPLASILTSAISLRLSEPMILALNSRLSVRVTKTSSAPSMTCALVMIRPSADKTKPEPTPRGCSSSCCCGRFGWGDGCWRGTLGIGRPKRRKNSNISSWPPPSGPPLGATFSRVRIFTTDGPTCSTRSVKSGKVRCCACAALNGTKATTAAMLQPAARDQTCSLFKPNGIIINLSLKKSTKPPNGDSLAALKTRHTAPVCRKHRIAQSMPVDRSRAALQPKPSAATLF